MSIKKAPKSRAAIEEIFQLIANKHGTQYPEIVIASHLGNMSAFAPRNWPTRGIPVKHWQKVAELAGLRVADVEKAHRVTRG